MNRLQTSVPPRLFNRRFRTLVEGELLTFFFSSPYAEPKDGKFTVNADAHFGFPRCEGDFAEAFRRELKTNAALKPNPAPIAPSDGDAPSN